MISFGDNGNPPSVGSYVAYVSGDVPAFAERVFLLWDGKRWSYPLSDQNYRGHIYAWVGPLPAVRPEDADMGKAVNEES